MENENVNSIIGFFNHPFFSILGGISTLASILIASYTLYLIVRGVLPVWIRLGHALSKRKVAIFSSPDNFNQLKNLLVDSGLFRDNNITHISINELSRANKFTFYLLHWKDFSEHFQKVLDRKDDGIPLIVYAPKDEGVISDEDMKIISHERSTVVVNFRGRLLNDIFTSMITSRYDLR